MLNSLSGPVIKLTRILVKILTSVAYICQPLSLRMSVCGLEILKIRIFILSSVLCALIAAAVLTKKMSQRKNLNQAWR